ncbi:MAG: hypothetical protein JNK65_08130 [Deltaproteobacteria bacterium]|nr:hypothetical protein [Deltaproteobacteria bacterium]
MQKATQALQTLMMINEMKEEDYAQVLEQKVGGEMLAIFEGYCRELTGSDQEDLVNTLVHLMTMGYLIRENEGDTPAPSRIHLE